MIKYLLLLFVCCAQCGSECQGCDQDAGFLPSGTQDSGSDSGDSGT